MIDRLFSALGGFKLTASADRLTARSEFGRRVRAIYRSVRFRRVLIAFDLTLIFSFIVLTFVPAADWVFWFNSLLAGLITLELMGRIVAARERVRCLMQLDTFIDLLIVISLTVPAIVGSFAFLRVFRAVHLFEVVGLGHALRIRSHWFAENEEVIRNGVQLLIFLLVTSAVVYEAQVGRNPSIATFSDALYFTVTTVTTTGFGDITLVGETGRLLSIAIMIAGISLFVRLAQAIIRPTKIQHECERCGLSRHDADAVHCKHCGNVVNIPSEGN
ncbi:ion channel [Sphingobium sp. Ndbn-10]|uniref:ion channel n=1 Tax=Sphingobium sp. Ndbn-10 TaxID=1667223 RepID=UPI000A55173C|nr:ion channel [Sphingobium sp. Ndbn-10]